MRPNRKLNKDRKRRGMEGVCYRVDVCRMGPGSRRLCRGGGGSGAVGGLYSEPPSAQLSHELPSSALYSVSQKRLRCSESNADRSVYPQPDYL